MCVFLGSDRATREVLKSGEGRPRLLVSDSVSTDRLPSRPSKPSTARWFFSINTWRISEAKSLIIQHSPSKSGLVGEDLGDVPKMRRQKLPGKSQKTPTNRPMIGVSMCQHSGLQDGVRKADIEVSTSSKEEMTSNFSQRIDAHLRNTSIHETLELGMDLAPTCQTNTQPVDLARHRLHQDLVPGFLMALECNTPLLK